MKYLKFLLLYIFCLVYINDATGQSYGIQTNLIIKPPYSLYLSDYVAPGSDKLIVSLFLKELSRTNYPVRLRLTIDGPLGIIQTDEKANFQPIYLNGGELNELSAEDLAPYFDPKNLIFQSGDKQRYLKTHRLDEGIYKFSIQAVDFDRKSPVSNKATTTAWMFLNKPPMWNLPKQDEVVKATFPQNVYFNWLAMNKTSLNSAFTTEYEFTLVEIYPINRNPNDAILTQAPIFQGIIENTSLVYDNNFPSLIPGRRYAARLKASDKSGLDLFENNGYSEVLAFTFGEECIAPIGIKADVTSVRANIKWEPNLNNTSFTVRVREKGKATANWFEQLAQSTEATITGLKAGTEYEYQVQSTCNSFSGAYSTPFSFKTTEMVKQDQKIDCGNNDPFPLVTNTKPLFTSNPGNIYKLGKFELMVSEVSGSNGSFKGQGSVFIPYMYATVRVAFDNLQVNENYEVFAGEARSLNTGLSLLSAADIAALAAEEDRNLSKDICLPITDNTVKTETQKFKDGDVVITLGDSPVKKGDIIDVNRQKVKVDENTKFKPGDNVTVAGKTYTIGSTGQVISDTKKDTKSSTSPLSNGNTVVSTGLAKSMRDKLKDVLEDLESENKKELSSNKKSVSKASDKLSDNLNTSKLFREVFSGFSDEFIKEGMSGKVVVPERSLKNVSDPLIGLYDEIRLLYISDSSLSLNRKKENHFAYLLSKNGLDARLDSLAELISKDLTHLDSSVVKGFEKDDRAGKAALRVYLKENLIKRIDSKVKQVDNSTGFNYHLIDENTLSASLKFDYNFKSNDKILPRIPFSLMRISQATILDTISPAVRAHALHKIITENGRIIGELSPSTPTDLPIGFTRNQSGIDYIIAVDNIVFRPDEAWIDAFLSTEIPMAGKRLGFSTTHINITPNGIKGAKSIKMLLMKNLPIRISNDLKLTIKTNNNLSFVEFDCIGFKNLAIEGEFEFCERLMVREGADGKPISGSRVKARFNSIIKGWDELITTVNIDPFQLTALKGVSFTVKDAVIDFSDKLNPLDIRFPKGYQSSYFIGENTKGWQGFYIRQVSIKLPEQFKDKAKGGNRIEIGGNNLLIDNLGLSGELFVKGLIPFENGDMNGWQYSLDTLAIGLHAYDLKYARFTGDLNIPVLEENSRLKYSAIISTNDEYIFSVAPNANVKIPMWKAGKVDLLPTSFVEIKVADGKFLPRAFLNGKLTIGGSLSSSDSEGTASSKLSIADIGFEGLQIATVRPYIKLGQFNFGSEKAGQKLAKFPIGIKNISFVEDGDDIGIGFQVKVNFMSEKDKGFGADAGIVVWGKMSESDGKRRYRYKDIQVEDASIDVDQGAYKIFGRVILFKNDPTYGSGFKGQVAAEFKPGIKVTATALFGSTKTEMRYWYVDAMVAFQKGIAIFPGVGLYGFGGGCYHRMSPSGFDPTGRSIGGSNSGVVYAPDSINFLGLKASVNIGTHPTPEAFNGEATFEMTFNVGGGIGMASFYGNAYFVTPPVPANLAGLRDKAKLLSNAKPSTSFVTDQSTPKGQISASIYIKYDAVSEVLHGNLKVFVNVAGGMLRGTAGNNCAGDAVIHFEQKEWYIYLGTPDKRIGIDLLGLAKLESYLMVGTNLPGSPPPPDNVQKILKMDLNYMRDLNTIKNASGFAFGSSLEISTGDLRFLMFYARLDAGAGFDIMLKNYGVETECAGRSGSIGVNGWYCNGQAYAYFQGKIGIMVDLPFYSGSYDIIDVGAAAVLQAKLPNPTWMRGIVGGYFSVLGGMVKGDCRFQVTIGEECEIIQKGQEVLKGMKVISELTPNDGEKNIGVFTAPQAVFNIPVNKPLQIKDKNQDIRFFRVKLQSFKVTEAGKEIPGKLSWNDLGDVAAFTSLDVLPDEKDLKITVKVVFEESINGVWQPVFENGKEVSETVENTFSTGKSPDFIPANVVAYSYPYLNQYNFYKDESKKGYIKLKQGMPKLFALVPNWKQKVRFTSGLGVNTDVDFTYGSEQINFSIPENLSLNTIYKFEIVNIPQTGKSAIDRNVDTVITKGSAEGMTVKTKEAEGHIEELQEKSIFSLYFKSSQFSRIGDKLSSLTKSPGWRRPTAGGLHELGSTVEGKEMFDNVELNGVKGSTERLVQLEAKLNDNPWYKDSIYPLVYKDYPIDGNMTVKWRNTKDLGLPPTKAMYIRENPSDVSLSESNISTGNVDFPTNEAAYIYDLEYYIQKDYADIQNQVANRYLTSNRATDRVKAILTTPYRNLQYGQYKFDVKYLLPGTSSTNYSREFTIMNPVKDK